MQAIWIRVASLNARRLIPGRAEVRFVVSPDGRVHNVKIVSNSGNKVLAEVATRTVQEMRLRPIPPSALAVLPDGYMPGDCDFTVHEAR